MVLTQDSEPAKARCRRLWVTLAIALAVAWLPGVTHADEAKPDSTGSAMWWGGAVDLAYPQGSFDPPGETPQLGFGAHLSIQPGHSRFGLRIEFGVATGDVSIDSVAVEFMPGFTTYETVKAGNDLYWFLGGAQWDPRPHRTSVYAYASLGALHVSPKGVAGGGTTVHPDVPGLPPSSTVFAYQVGVGSRLLVGKTLGLSAEAEYLQASAADYVGSAGIEGSNPQRYASRNSQIGLFIVRLGFVRGFHPGD